MKNMGIEKCFGRVQQENFLRGMLKVKNFLKMFFILIMAAFLCGAGFYLTLLNTSKLLAAGEPNLQCCWLSSGLQIKTAKWRETIILPTPVHIRNHSGKWLIYSRHFALTVNTKPLQIQWRKSFQDGKTDSRDEY